MTRTDLKTPPANPHKHDHGLTATDKAIGALAARMTAVEKDAAVTKALLIAATGSGSFHPPVVEPPAYTASGFGKDALSGTARTDVHVTNLNSSGAGSLRAAMTGGDNRRIVFDVSGTISVTGDEIELTGASNIEVDGSTSSSGITISGYGFRFNGCDHIVVRNIAFRSDPSAWYGQCEIVAGSSHVLIDRCSFSGWSWRGVNIGGGTHHVTVQWCFFGGFHDWGTSYNYPSYVCDLSYQISYDHCVFYDGSYRQPGAAYDMDEVGSTPSVVTMDVANCLMWTTRGAYDGGSNPDGYYSCVNSHNNSWTNVRQCYFHTTANTSANHAIHTETSGYVYQSGCKFKDDAGSLSTTNAAGSPYSTTGYELALESTATIAAEQALAHAGRYPRDATDGAFAAEIEVT
jgi:hypothetical protein